MTAKNLFATATLAVACLSLASCGDKAQTSTPATVTVDGTQVVLPIAYVRVDSVLATYKYSVEVQEKLAADAKASEQQLQGRAASFQKAVEDFERRARINAFVSQEAAQAEQAKLQKRQQELATLQQELAGKLAQQQALMQEDLMKKIDEELRAFNAGRFKLILSNVGVLYADDALDITAEFIDHLNASYGSGAPTATADSVAKQ